jgi:hypothetical protein
MVDVNEHAAKRGNTSEANSMGITYSCGFTERDQVGEELPFCNVTKCARGYPGC